MRGLPQSTTRDRRLVLAAAFVRAAAVGMTGVLIATELARRGFVAAEIGSVVTAGLAGAAGAAAFVTVLADRLGRRRSLVLLAALAAAGGLAVAVADRPLVVAAAACMGMLNGMGRDRGAAVILDQAILPATTTSARRTTAFAWYNVMQDGGHALGGLLAAAPALLRDSGLPGNVAGTAAFGLYAALLAATAALYAGLSPACETAASPATVRLSAPSRRIVARISALMAVDSLAGGFLTAALLSYFFLERFSVSEATIGVLFFASRAANTASHLGAAWLASRIGLVNTMVFTHIPSSLLLATVTVAPSFAAAATLFLLREGLVEMDVPTRQSFVTAVVRPEERTAASGITHIVRLLGWAIAPACAGALMQHVSLAAPILIGAALKITYDLLLWVSFRRVRPPEE